MSSILNWLDHRTGYRKLAAEALYENIPGGSRWRYVWGSTLTFMFAVQVLTGIFLWMYYSPSSQSAWESVYYLQTHVSGGWLLRGVHHYAAQAMVVLLALHLAQVVIDGAYKAPREINFWLGLILMMLVLGLALTGYLLPWDQKGYWATKVATRIAGLTPVAGPQLEKLVVGGADYGHYTLTRFFALHAGVLPGLLVAVLFLHVTLFRRHGITAKISAGRPRPDQYFWPDQVLKDAVVCLVILAVVFGLAIYLRPELGAPADGVVAYSAARPEWYFLFLFQFLKLFHGELGEVVGAIAIPSALMLFMFSMPFLGRIRVGHAICVTVIGGVLVGAMGLTVAALYQDDQSRWFPNRNFADVEKVLNEIEIDLRKNGPESKYQGKKEDDRLAAYFGGDRAKVGAFQTRLAGYRAFRKSREYLDAVADARAQSERAQELAAAGIPPEGALMQLRNDPKTQGPRLFRAHCAACHDCADAKGNGIVTLRPLNYYQRDKQGRLIKEAKPVPNGAPNLFHFGSREWIAGLLDPQKISQVKYDTATAQILDAPYFGNTMHRQGEESEDESMVAVVEEQFSKLDPAGRANREKLIAALSAEAGLPSQQAADAESIQEASAKLAAGASEQERQKAVVAARAAAIAKLTCLKCHKFHGQGGDEGSAPDLTGYGSRQWLIDFIGNPAHDRFYGDKNDRMPAFAADAKKPENNLLTRHDLELIVDWLRGTWYEPPRGKDSPP